MFQFLILKKRRMVMCRIAAVVHRTKTCAKYAPNLLIDIELKSSEKQHRDGFGIMCNNKVYKKSDPCSDVVNTSDFVNWLNTVNTGFMPVLCHARQATVGRSYFAAKRDDFAHPFCLDHFTLVHNGHFINSVDVKKKFDIPEYVVVDSEMFLWVLNKIANGNHLNLDIIQKTIDEFIGPFVIFIYDDRPELEGGFWILMGEERSMHFFETKDLYIFCTESTVKDIINRTLARLSTENLNFEYHPVSNMFKLDQSTLYRMEPNGLFKYGSLKTRVEYPKVAVDVKGVSLRESSSATVTDVTNISEICLKVSLRNEILVKFNLTEEMLNDALKVLSPLLPIDSFSLSLDELKILYDFLLDLEIQYSGFKSFLNIEKIEVWEKINELILHPEQACFSVSENFEVPYWINDLDVLYDCLEKLTKVNEV